MRLQHCTFARRLEINFWILTEKRSASESSDRQSRQRGVRRTRMRTPLRPCIFCQRQSCAAIHRGNFDPLKLLSDGVTEAETQPFGGQSPRSGCRFRGNPLEIRPELLFIIRAQGPTVRQSIIHENTRRICKITSRARAWVLRGQRHVSFADQKLTAQCYRFVPVQPKTRASHIGGLCCQTRAAPV